MSALLDLDELSVALGKLIVVESVSLGVERGEIIALLGSNGAGKTTLLRASLGLAPICAGAVLLGGADPRQLSARERATRAAYLPQRPQAVWPVPVEAIVALGRFCYGAVPERMGAADQAAVDAALDACSLLNLRARRMDMISGGERARVHLARVLAQQAPLLLLDEPSAGLDPAQALAVSDILRRHAAGGGGIVFSTHDIALAARTASRVVLLHAGRVIADGAPEVALKPEALERTYGGKGRLDWFS